MKEELCYLSATALVRLYRRKQISPVEITRAVLNQITKYNKKVNAFCFVDKKGASDAAKESEQR